LFRDARPESERRPMDPPIAPPSQQGCQFGRGDGRREARGVGGLSEGTPQLVAGAREHGQRRPGAYAPTSLGARPLILA
jgi:hypothetical protein